MISILIPVYNYNITRLVSDLHSQAVECNQDFEIIILDDCSDEKEKLVNRNLTNLACVYYEELPHNVGRSKIRNILAQKAQYDYLLFMDCDAQVPHNQYLKNYLQECIGTVVLCGGTMYETILRNRQESLRWVYGHKRETRTAKQRNINPNISFTTFNFIISKQIINQITFNEHITMYGHEDTLFGYELKKQNYTIKHIDNPLIHLGLDSNQVFLHKTRLSIESLLVILNNPHIDNAFTNDVKILGYYKKLQSLRIAFLVSIAFKITRNFIENRLIFKQPNLKLFDIYKLGYLCFVARK